MTNSRCGWALVFLGVILLVVLGKTSLMVVLLPIAILLAFTLLWVGHKPGNVTSGLK